jgi:hypothetical protein
MFPGPSKFGSNITETKSHMQPERWDLFGGKMFLGSMDSIEVSQILSLAMALLTVFGRINDLKFSLKFNILDWLPSPKTLTSQYTTSLLLRIWRQFSSFPCLSRQWMNSTLFRKKFRTPLSM